MVTLLALLYGTQHSIGFVLLFFLNLALLAFQKEFGYVLQLTEKSALMPIVSRFSMDSLEFKSTSSSYLDLNTSVLLVFTSVIILLK